MITPERGAISVVAAAGALTLCLCALAAADVGAMLAARGRAQAAADGAALAAVVEQVPVLAQGDDPEGAARAYAERNGAMLLRCECPQGENAALVETAVEPRLVLIRGWFGRRAHAAARAEVDPDVLSYRDPG